MLTNGTVELDRDKSTALDERLFELAVRLDDRSRPRAREAAAGRESDRTLHPLSAAWANRREDAQRQVLDEQLMQEHRISALGLFSCGLAHDLNNMLTIIINNAALAMLEIGRDAPGYTSISETLRAADNAKKLTSRILKFGRGRTFEMRPIDINALINDMLGMMKTLIPNNVLKRVILDPKLPLVNADPEQLIHALMNLVTNAIDAMPEGGMLTISTRTAAAYDDAARGACCHIQIADTGSGIPEQDQEDIFKPFFTTKKSGKGTGLGLPITASIIKKHDGKISVRSGGGQGTSVHVCIPFA